MERKNRYFIILAAISMFFMAMLVSASSKAEDMPWERIFYGATAIAIDPVNSSHIYAAAKDGVYNSEDGGNNWINVASASEFVWSIAIDPYNPENVYVTALYGIISSADGGANWQHSGYVYAPKKLVVDPTDTNVLFAHTWNGLFKSSDRGQTWTQVNILPGVPEYYTDFNALDVDRAHRAVYYGVRRSSYGYGVDMYKTTDGGENWVYLGVWPRACPFSC